MNNCSWKCALINSLEAREPIPNLLFLFRIFLRTEAGEAD